MGYIYVYPASSILRIFHAVALLLSYVGISLLLTISKRISMFFVTLNSHVYITLAVNHLLCIAIYVVDCIYIYILLRSGR